MRRSEQGFTLIELLVVVAVIGILAAIALPAFLGQTRGAGDAKAKSDVRNAENAIEAYWAEHGSYDVTPAALTATEGALTSAVNLAVSGGESTYRITSDSTRGARFVVEKTRSGVTRTCTPAGTGGCEASGEW